MSLHDVRPTLGAVLVGSGFAAVFVIFFSFGDCNWADIGGLVVPACPVLSPRKPCTTSGTIKMTRL